MALRLPSCAALARLSPPSLASLPRAPVNINVRKCITCALSTQNMELTINRRSANYPTSFGDYDFIHSLKSDYTGDMYERQLQKLKEEVRCLLIKTNDPIAQLKLIDTLEHLGVGYHFEKEIKEALSIISRDDNNGKIKQDLYATALRFRLLRQNGFEVSQDVFNCFKDEKGELMATLTEDTKGLLSLYEASYLAFEGETTLDEARAFATKKLQDLKGNADQKLRRQVEHALELPYHWRMPRLEARWYTETYVQGEDADSLLFELAKLDYNMVQALYQCELKIVSRWWKTLGLGKHLTFARDRLMECFLWTVGTSFEPQFGYFRQTITKVNQLITVIDDIYDIYGSLEELELFTDVVARWDVHSIEQLPQYMKICFLALFNFANETAYDILKDTGRVVIQYLQKSWTDLCEAYLLEAKWYNKGYTPTFDEYLENACISISGYVILIHTYFSLKPMITEEALECIDNNSDLIRYSSTILRLWDDWGTSTDELKRGDVPKAIQCYMHEKGCSEVIARENIRVVISDLWKKMNKESISAPFPRSFVSAALSLERTSQSYYQYGDGFGVPNNETKEKAMSLFVKPITTKM